jgi:hypothetical protein
MNDALIRVSLFLLFFYMSWFMWDQNKLIENQSQQIKQLQIQSFYHMVTIQQLRAKNNQSPFYKKTTIQFKKL